jgi:predicted nucleic acid-binding protein
LPLPSRYYLDTNVVIAIVEAPRPLSSAQLELVQKLDSGRLSAVTSELTLAEVLVKPMAIQNAIVVANYLRFLDGRRNLRVVPVSRNIIIEAARLRAASGIKLADALHLATATLTRCVGFITNDRRIRQTGGLAVLPWEPLVT